jgi:hypothetical protein
MYGRILRSGIAWGLGASLNRRQTRKVFPVLGPWPGMCPGRGSARSSSCFCSPPTSRRRCCSCRLPSAVATRSTSASFCPWRRCSTGDNNAAAGARCETERLRTDGGWTGDASAALGLSVPGLLVATYD